MHKKLLKIQEELKAPKNQTNRFGKYNYRSCEDILEAVKPLLAKEGLVLTLSDEITEVGSRVYVKSTAVLRYATEIGAVRIAEGEGNDNWKLEYADNETISVTAYAREEETKKGMDGSQITGAASSYARKYALNGLFLIDDAKDSDSTNTHDKETVINLNEDII